MNVTTEQNHDVSVVRVNESRLMYPLLSEFSNTITGLIGSGRQIKRLQENQPPAKRRKPRPGRRKRADRSEQA